MDIGVGLEPWQEGEDLFLARKGFSEFKFDNFGSFANVNTVTIDPTGIAKVLTGSTGAPDAALGEFLIESSSASANVNEDATIQNIISTINNGNFIAESGKEFDMIGAIDGKPSAHYELAVVVEKGKAEILSTFDYIEEITKNKI